MVIISNDNPTAIAHLIDALHAWPLIFYLVLRQSLNALEEGLVYLYRVRTSLLEAHYDYCKRRDALRANYQNRTKRHES